MKVEDVVKQNVVSTTTSILSILNQASEEELEGRTIKLEWTGKFFFHLYCMELIIPIFHSTGHFPYVKSTRIYLQQMKIIKDKMNKEEYLSSSKISRDYSNLLVEWLEVEE